MRPGAGVESATHKPTGRANQIRGPRPYAPETKGKTPERDNAGGGLHLVDGLFIRFDRFVAKSWLVVPAQTNRRYHQKNHSIIQ
jgi:hypothetical protein